MKKIILSILSLFLSISLFAQDVVSISNQSEKKEPIKYESFVNPDWEKWSERSYNYGFDTKKVEVPIFFNSSIATNSTIMVRGGDEFKKRWGLHVFEGYAADDTSRLTMILNKHFEEKMPVAEIYYFGSAYGDTAYNWTRIGSDVPYHSYMFSLDSAIFYGSVQMHNPLTLANIGKEDLREKSIPWAERKEIIADAKKRIKREDFTTDSYHYHAIEGEYRKEYAKYRRAQKLKNASDGTIFYDKDRKIVVIKIDGKWHKLETTPIDVEY